MPSEKILEQKKQIVSDLADTLSSSVAGVIVDYKGISVEDDTKLRKDLREAGVKYAVVKNTILKLAAEKAELSEIDDVLEGTTAIATSAEDYTAAARILCKSTLSRALQSCLPRTCFLLPSAMRSTHPSPLSPELCRLLLKRAAQPRFPLKRRQPKLKEKANLLIGGNSKWQTRKLQAF